MSRVYDTLNPDLEIYFLDELRCTSFPAYAGMTIPEFKISPNGCHSRESGNPVLFSIRTYKYFLNRDLGILLELAVITPLLFKIYFSACLGKARLFLQKNMGARKGGVVIQNKNFLIINNNRRLILWTF